MFVDTNLVLNGTSESTSAVGEGSAGGYLFGQKLNLVKGHASYVTPKEGNLKGNVAFYFLGYKIFGKDYNNTSGYFFHDEWSKGLDQSTTIHFTLGPIPMSAKIGAQGNATVEYRMGILPLRANADIVPGVNSKVYIQIGVDLVVGGAGGGSDLVLINDKLAVVGRLHVLLDSKGPYFAAALNADNDMTTLLEECTHMSISMSRRRQFHPGKNNSGIGLYSKWLESKPTARSSVSQTRSICFKY